MGTGKKSLIGIFEHILVEKFPAQHYQLSVYVKFASAQGKCTFKLELEDLEKSQIIGKAFSPELSIPNKLDSYELAFNLVGFEFSHHGTYEFKIYANDKWFASKTFKVVQVTPHDING